MYFPTGSTVLLWPCRIFPLCRGTTDVRAGVLHLPLESVRLQAALPPLYGPQRSQLQLSMAAHRARGTKVDAGRDGVKESHHTNVSGGRKPN